MQGLGLATIPHQWGLHVCIVDLRVDGLIPAFWDRLKEDLTGRREHPRSGTVPKNLPVAV